LQQVSRLHHFLNVCQEKIGHYETATQRLWALVSTEDVFSGDVQNSLLHLLQLRQIGLEGWVQALDCLHREALGSNLPVSREKILSDLLELDDAAFLNLKSVIEQIRISLQAIQKIEPQLIQFCTQEIESIKGVAKQAGSKRAMIKAYNQTIGSPIKTAGLFERRK